MKMNKLIAMGASLALCLGLLAGCGTSSTGGQASAAPSASPSDSAAPSASPSAPAQLSGVVNTNCSTSM